MKLYVMRHGDAGNWFGEANTPEDRKRKLSSLGRNSARAVAKWMKDNGEEPSRVFHSPVPRAKETAEIVAGAFGLKAEENENLDIEQHPDGLIRQLAADESQKRVLIVGHRDSLGPALANLNFLDREDVDRIARGELRVLRVDRKTAAWKEKGRVTPAELGAVEFDVY